ncbi:MAG: hypothetical protein AB1Z66_00870 [Candidatus Limnocylindrales bacterium]
MRTLRLSLVGTVILVLVGGGSSMVAAQEAPGGVYVTGTSECLEPPGRTIQTDHVAVELHEFRTECELTSSDPRLSGPGVFEIQQFCLMEDGGHVCMGWGTSEVTGPDGTWVGTLGWVEDPSRSKLAGWGVQEGTGANEGWTYWYHIPDLMAPSSPEHGILYQGPPPPWAERTLPLTPAE